MDCRYAHRIKGKFVSLIPPTDNQILKFDAAADSFKLEADASGGTTAWDDVADPDNSGLTTISFDNAELSLFTGDNDAVASFFTIQNTDADHANNLYLLHLDYSADDGDVDADFIKFEDSGSIVMTIQQDGEIATDGGLTVGTNATNFGSDGSGVVNEQGASVDFRVEGNTITDLFLVDGSADAIDINGKVNFDFVATTTTHNLSIIPSTAIGVDDVWHGIHIDLAALAPSGTGADVTGIEIDLSGVDISNNPVIHGLEIDVPIRRDAIHVNEGQVVINNAPDNTIASEFHALDIRVDTKDLASTSAWAAMSVTAVGGSSGEVDAIIVRNDISPIRHEKGTFTTPSQSEFAGRETGGGATWADTVDTKEVFSADNDEVFVGSTSQFSQIEVILGTFSNKDLLLNFYYNTAADTWTQFFPDDETSGFQSSSLISWVPTSISGSWTNDGDPGEGDTSAGFWIRIERTRNGAITEPVVTTIKVGTVVEYKWDKDGNLSVNSTSADTIKNLTNASTTRIIITDSLQLSDNLFMSTLDLDTLVIALDGVSATNSFTAGTRFFLYMDGATETFSIDTTGTILTGTWEGTTVAVNQGGTGATALDDIIGGTAITVTAGANTIIAGNATIAVTAGGIGTTQIGTDGVSADELNATGVEAELEAVMDLEDMQGAVTDAQVPDDLTATSYLLLAAILDSLNNYDNDVLFTQGATAIAAAVIVGADLQTGAIDSIGKLNVDLWNSAAFVTYASDTLLIRDVTDGALKKTLIATSGMNASAFNDSLNNYDGNVVFTQGNSALASNAVDNINELSVALWNTASVATFASGADTVLIRDATDGTLKKAIITTGGGGTGFINLPIQSAKLTGGFITAGAGIDAGDGNWRLLFDASATESGLWQFRLPSTYSSALIAKLLFSMTSATSDTVDFEVDVMALTPGTTDDLDTAAFASTNEINGGTVVPAAAGRVGAISITLTNDDGAAAGDILFIRVNRDHDDASDAATGDAELVGLTIEWTE